MQPKTLKCGGARALVSVLILLCVLYATTATVTHFHLDGQARDDAHCSLCMLQSILIAVVVSVALCLSWQLLMFTDEHEAERPGFVVFRITSIRPPPLAQLFR